MNKTYTYARVSTDKQENGLEVQQKLLFDFCEANGFKNVIHLADNAVSGGKFLFNRPEGSKLKNLESGDSLIVSRHDRLFRNFINAINVTHELVNIGVNLYFIQDSYEPVSFINYHKEFKLYLDYALAHMEKRKIGSNTTNGLINRRINGQTNCPERYGYTNIGKGKGGIEVVNETEQLIIARMIKEKQSGLSYEDIAKGLNTENILSKKGIAWTRRTVENVISKNI